MSYEGAEPKIDVAIKTDFEYGIEFSGLNFRQYTALLGRIEGAIRGVAKRIGEAAITDPNVRDFILEKYREFVTDKFESAGQGTWRDWTPKYKLWMRRHTQSSAILIQSGALKNAYLRATVDRNYGAGYANFTLKPWPATNYKGISVAKYAGAHQNWGKGPYGFRDIWKKNPVVNKFQSFDVIDKWGRPRYKHWSQALLMESRIWTSRTTQLYPIKLATRKYLPETADDQQYFAKAILEYMMSSYLRMNLKQYMEDSMNEAGGIL